MTPRYTPYDGTAKPFAIGLSAIDPARWIEPDGDLLAYLDEKTHLRNSHFEAVFQSVRGSEAAQEECLGLLIDHLTATHGDIYKKSGDLIEFYGRTVELDNKISPLLTAGSLIADDLAILEKKENGWNLTAGYVSFPSSWSLKDKIGKPMEGVHAHVPGFEGGTRNAAMINRIFDNLQPDLPAERFNWSIYPEGELFWPPEKGARSDASPFVPSQNFIRVERQTLRRLPKSGAIVFTIRIYHNPITQILARPDGAALAHALAARLEELSEEQLAYKGMRDKKARLTEFLRGS
jgi:hypothetical protein